MVLNGQPIISMSKLIRIDIHLSIATVQYFEVPLDYEITGSTALEAYENLSCDFEEQNPCAIHRPEYVELGEYNCDFIGLGNTFYIQNKVTGEGSKMRFEIQQ